MQWIVGVPESSKEAIVLNHTDRHRQLIRTVLCGCLLLGLFIYVAAPRAILDCPSDWFPTQKEDLQLVREATSRLQASVVPIDHAVEPVEQPSNRADSQSVVWSVAGFPFDAIHQQKSRSAVRYHVDGLALLLDLVALALLVGGGVAFSYHYHHSIQHRFRLIGLWGVSFALFCVGTGWLVREANQRQTELSRHGRLMQLESVNLAVFQLLPASLRMPWTHSFSFAQNSPKEKNLLGEIRTKQDRSANDSKATNPTKSSERVKPDLATCLAAHPELHAISLHGKLSGPLRDSLRSSGFLHTLRLSDAPDGESIATLVTELDRLHSIRISLEPSKARSQDAKSGELVTTSNSQLDFRGMKELRTLTISGINQSELTAETFNAPWLETLSLDFAGVNGDPLVVSALPHLRELQIAASRSAMSSIAIELSQMPELRSLKVPVFRPVDLSLKDVPLLRAIHTTHGARHEIEMLTADSAPWFSGLAIKNAPSLAKLSMTLVSMQRWSIQGCPNLRSLVMTQPSTRRRSLLRRGSDDEQAQHLETVWRWLEGELPLNSIKIGDMDLRQVDMTRWSKMKYLERVELEGCRTSPGQVAQLASIASLERIRASDIRVDDSTVERLLSAHSRWVALEFDWSFVKSIRIVNQPNLTSANGVSALRATTVHLENLPRFQQPLLLRSELDELVIKNVPLLKGLIISRPLPEGTQLSGIEGLRDFCARNSTLSQSHYNALSNAKNLQSLLLPECRVTPDFVVNLHQWKLLMAIDLTSLRVVDESLVSTEIDDESSSANRRERTLHDEDFKSLGTLDSLLIANFDNNQVSAEAIRQIGRCEQLQALSLMNCGLVSHQLEPLIKSQSLAELRVEPTLGLPRELEEAVAAWGEGRFQDSFAGIWDGRYLTRDNGYRPPEGRRRPEWSRFQMPGSRRPSSPPAQSRTQVRGFPDPARGFPGPGRGFPGRGRGFSSRSPLEQVL